LNPEQGQVLPPPLVLFNNVARTMLLMTTVIKKPISCKLSGKHKHARSIHLETHLPVIGEPR
jgi:hypothetical protein